MRDILHLFRSYPSFIRPVSMYAIERGWPSIHVYHTAFAYYLKSELYEEYNKREPGPQSPQFIGTVGYRVTDELRPIIEEHIFSLINHYTDYQRRYLYFCLGMSAVYTFLKDKGNDDIKYYNRWAMKIFLPRMMMYFNPYLFLKNPNEVYASPSAYNDCNIDP